MSYIHYSHLKCKLLNQGFFLLNPLIKSHVIVNFVLTEFSILTFMNFKPTTN